MKGTGESAAVLAATLVWLALLAFPVGLAVSGTQPLGRLIRWRSGTGRTSR